DRSENIAEQPAAHLARPLEVLAVDVRDERGVLLGQLRAREELLLDLLHVLRDRALLRARRLGEIAAQRSKSCLDLDGRRGHRLDLTRGDTPILASRRLSDELTDAPRVLRRDRLRELDEHTAAERADLLERRQRGLLRPVRETTSPEVVVLVEVALLAGGEVVAPSSEPVVERRERLVAIEVDALALARDLVLEVGEILLPLLAIDLGDDRRREVEDLLELARSDVEQVADAARDALEEPDVRDRRREVDVPHALASHLLAGDLDAAALADDALVADALVLAAVALPVLRGTVDALVEEAVALGLERAVVDRLRLRHLAGRPVADLLRRCEADPDRVEVVDVGTASGSVHLAPRTSLSCVRDLESHSSLSTSARSTASTGASSTSPSSSSAASTSSPPSSMCSSPSSTSSALGWRAVARSEPGDRSMPSSSAARSSSSSSSRTSTSRPSSESTWTSSASDCISLSRTLKDSGIDGSAMFSPLTIASYALTRPIVSSDLMVSISCSVYAEP